MMTKLFLVRHGESRANEMGLLAGHSNFELTELGRVQANETAEALGNEPFAAVYSSDLVRAQDTARPHAERRGLAVIPKRALREVYCGDWESLSFAYLGKNEPERYQKGFVDSFLTAHLPNGESVPEAGNRFYDAVIEIAKENEGKTVCIVAHGGVIRSFWAKICGTPAEIATAKHPYPSNSSYCVVHYDGERFLPVEFSHDAHLSTVTHLHI